MYKLTVTGDIALFLQCKRCFWLSVVKGLKRPDNIFPSLPSGMDRILKEHFDRFAKIKELPPEIRQQDHLKDCCLFDDKNLLEAWRDAKRGLAYKDPQSGVILKGAIDNIIKKGEKLIVLDYKTRGYPLKENTHQYYQVQMDFYNFLLRKNGHDTEDFAFLLFYYPNKVTPTGEVIFDTTLKVIQTDVQKAIEILNQAIKTLQDKIPQRDPNCSYCEYKQKEYQGDLINL